MYAIFIMSYFKELLNDNFNLKSLKLSEDDTPMLYTIWHSGAPPPPPPPAPFNNLIQDFTALENYEGSLQSTKNS